MKNGINGRWAEVFRTLGHPVRIKIIEALLDCQKCVTNICSSVNLPQGTVSQHLSIMRNKGILGCEREGSNVKYFIIEKTVERFIKIIKDNS